MIRTCAVLTVATYLLSRLLAGPPATMRSPQTGRSIYDMRVLCVAQFVCVLGLLVTLVGVFTLGAHAHSHGSGDSHGHAHDHGHPQEHGHAHAHKEKCSGEEHAMLVHPADDEQPFHHSNANMRGAYTSTLSISYTSHAHYSHFHSFARAYIHPTPNCRAWYRHALPHIRNISQGCFHRIGRIS